MARKSRYMNYVIHMDKGKSKEKKSSQASVLKKLKSLKNQEFIMNVPIGDTDGK